jgi:hypothetical protein
MTLHISGISRGLSLQVSDRLVSGGIIDPFANKNLIYWAKGSLVSIAYTGLAYGLSPSNANTPTDEWIAEKLWGEPIPKGPDGVKPATFVYQRIHKWLDIGQSIKLLADELCESLAKLPNMHQAESFEMIIVGWEETRRRGVHPIAVQILKPRGDKPIEVKRCKRDWYFGSKAAFFLNPSDYVSTDEFKQLIKNRHPMSVDDWEDLFVDCTRQVSAKYPDKVGPNCLSILLPPLNAAPIRIRFVPATLHTATLLGHKFPVVFSPWIIGPHGCTAPAIMKGGFNYQMGPFVINMEGPTVTEKQKGILLYMGSLNRPRPF